MRLPSIHQAFLEARRAVHRFPFVLLSAFAGVIAILVLVEIEPERWQKPTVAYPVTFAAALGIPFLMALALGAEKRKWNPTLSVGAQLIGILLLVVYGFTVPKTLLQEPAAPFIRFGLLAAGLVLLVMILPFLRKGEQNGFWQYNKALFSRLFVTAIFAVVLFAGLAIALAALDQLFGISIPGKRYAELWVLVAGLFSPWFFLSGVPEDLDGLDRIEDYPKGLKVFAQYVLCTLVIVYLVILYAYLLKILIQWNWPKGWVSSLILGFSATAILSLLLMHPIRDRSGNTWIRVAGKWLYVLLIPLIVVLFLAVMERIGDYGITERRYAGMVLGIWLSAQVLYFLFGGSRSIKFTIGSLCVCAFLMSFGPWGMVNVTQRSQAGRLQKLLMKNGVLVNGSIKKEHAQVPQEDAREITSIVSYLHTVHGYDAIQPWFSEKLREQTKNGHGQNLLVSDVLNKMGVEYIDFRAGAGMIRFDNFNSRTPADIAGYDRILRQQIVAKSGNMALHRFEGEGISYEVNDDLDTMNVIIGNKQTGFETVQFDIAGFVKKLLSQHGSLGNGRIRDVAPEAMTLVSEHNSQKAKIFFRQLELRRSRDKIEISFFNIDIAYTVQK